MRSSASAVLAFYLLLAAGGLVVAQPQASRVVAVGDIHGALDPFVDILDRTGLIDSERRWAGGTTTFVQTGDYMDRGRDVRAVMDLLMALERQAGAAGGRAFILLGNHEVMNLIGDQRDATPEIYASFADDSSQARRERAWRDYEALADRRRRARPELPEVYAQTREAWMAAHPPGWLEYQGAMGPDGEYGRWLRARPVTAQVSGTLLMHAGIDPTSTLTPDEVETRVHDEIQRMDRYRRRLVDARLTLPFFTLDEMLHATLAEIGTANSVIATARERGTQPDLREFDIPLLQDGLEIIDVGKWDLLADNGPLWYRGYANATDEALKGPVTDLLTRLGLRRIVVAHTPQPAGRIVSRLGGSVVLIDTGMLASRYGGRASALEIVGDRLTAIYGDGRAAVSSTPTPASVGSLQR